MKKFLAISLSALGIAFGAFAVEATVKPESANAFVLGGSCYWHTDTNAYWYFSPTYGVYYHYEGHTMINGYNYRTYYVYSSVSGVSQRWYVYCG